MNEISKIGQTMSSREIADLVEKRHDNVKRTIESLINRAVIRSPQIEEYRDSLNRPATEYKIGKRDSFVIVAQLSPEFTARLVDRWQELETAISPAFLLPRTMAEALRLAANLADENSSLKSEIAETAPTVQAFDRIAHAEGSMCITDAAKTLQMQPKALFEWLNSHQWIYRRPGSAEWTGYQDKLQRLVLEHKVNTVLRTDGSEKVTTRVLVTAKGIADLAKRMERAA